MNIIKKSLVSTLVGLAVVVVFTSTSYAEEEKVLNIYNWPDYIAVDTIPNFEKETGIKVRYDTFDSNEVLNAKLIAKKTGYDIVIPSSNWAKPQIDKGLFQKLDKSKLPNLKNLDPNLLAQLATLDKNNEYLVDWLWGYTTVGINVDKTLKALGKTAVPDNLWELVFNPTYAAKLKSCGITFLDSSSDIFQPALHYLGKPLDSTNQEDYKLAFDMLNKVRPYIKSFNSGGQIDELANGSVCVAVGWAGDFNQARKRSKEKKTEQHIVAVIPKAGAVMFMDTMAIPVDAKHPSNAHQFINYILRAEVHAALTNAVDYANPNKAALKFVKPELRSDQSIFLSADNIARLIAPVVVDDKTQSMVEEYFAGFKTGVLNLTVKNDNVGKKKQKL